MCHHGAPGLRAHHAVRRRRPRLAPGHLRRRPHFRREGEWVRLQGHGDRGRLLLQGAGRRRKHQHHLRLRGDRRQRGEGARAQHPRRLHGAHRLRARRPQRAAHPPARHRDGLRPPGRPRRRLHNHRQQARLQDHRRRRRLRVPARPRPFPEEQRRRARLRHLRLQQPVPRHAVPRHDALRRHAAGARPRAHDGVPGRHQGGAEDQVQARPQKDLTKQMPSTTTQMFLPSDDMIQSLICTVCTHFYLLALLFCCLLDLFDDRSSLCNAALQQQVQKLVGL